MTRIEWFHLIASVFALTLAASFVTFFMSFPLRQAGLRAVAGALLALWFAELFALLGWGIMAFIWSVN